MWLDLLNGCGLVSGEGILVSDKNMDYALDMGVRSVPTVIVYDGDKLINRSQGVQPEGFYKDILKNL